MAIYPSKDVEQYEWASPHRQDFMYVCCWINDIWLTIYIKWKNGWANAQAEGILI